MKKLLLIVILFGGFITSAQSTYDPYIAVGVSFTNDSNFSETAYPSFEAGVCHRNIALAAVVGRGNFQNVFSETDGITNYWVEAKLAPYYDVGSFRGSVFFGYGAYINDHSFTDVGVGVAYMVGDFSFGVAFNRWDEVNYLSPSISYNL